MCTVGPTLTSMRAVGPGWGRTRPGRAGRWLALTAPSDAIWPGSKVGARTISMLAVVRTVRLLISDGQQNQYSGQSDGGGSGGEEEGASRH